MGGWGSHERWVDRTWAGEDVITAFICMNKWERSRLLVFILILPAAIPLASAVLAVFTVPCTRVENIFQDFKVTNNIRLYRQSWKFRLGSYFCMLFLLDLGRRIDCLYHSLGLLLLYLGTCLHFIICGHYACLDLLADSGLLNKLELKNVYLLLQ